MPRNVAMPARTGVMFGLVVVIAACSSEPAGSASEGGFDTRERDVAALDVVVPDTNNDSTGDDGARDAQTVDARADVLIDDAFVRPDVIPDTASDAPSETSADAASDSVSDAPADAAEDAAGDSQDTETDAPAADVVRNAAIDASGTSGCLEWTIRSEYDVFDFKGSDFLVTYAVTNRCSETFLYRVEHMNDLFPMAIHKNGELWTYMGLCPGRGIPFEWAFRTRGEGISRGFLWRAADHESLLTDCGVEYDATATYELVGYGSTEIDTFSPNSTTYELTPAFPITIRE